MFLENYHIMRVEVENHIDTTAYTIAYSSSKKITREIIEARIADDIIMTRMIRVDYNENQNMSTAKCELSLDGKTAVVYNNKKVNGLWHTGATIAISLNDTSTKVEDDNKKQCTKALQNNLETNGSVEYLMEKLMDALGSNNSNE